jgi:hypothetical protein
MGTLGQYGDGHRIETAPLLLLEMALSRWTIAGVYMTESPYQVFDHFPQIQ